MPRFTACGRWRPPPEPPLLFALPLPPGPVLRAIPAVPPPRQLCGDPACRRPGCWDPVLSVLPAWIEHTRPYYTEEGLYAALVGGAVFAGILELALLALDQGWLL